MVFDHAQLKTLVREITARIHATSLSTDSDLNIQNKYLLITIKVNYVKKTTGRRKT